MSTVVDLSPAEVDLRGIRAGDLNRVAFTVHVGGAPVDLTGATITAQAREFAGSATALDAHVTPDADPTSGRFTMRWDGDEIRTLLGSATTWQGVWDVQIAQGPDTTTIAHGSFACELDVTRP